jgi:hypothetical protein
MRNGNYSGPINLLDGHGAAIATKQFAKVAHVESSMKHMNLISLLQLFTVKQTPALTLYHFIHCRSTSLEAFFFTDELYI